MQKSEIVKLVGLCKQGDEKAYEILYRSFYPMAYRYALSLSRCEADAHDIAQEALIQAHMHIDNLDSPELFAAWLKRITFNQSTRLFRKNTRVVYNDAIITGMEGKVDPSMDKDPNKLMRFHSDRDLMVYFFGMLPKGQREVMELYYFEQMTTKEIAEKIKLPEGTVKSRIFTAKKDLRTKIKQYENAEDIALDFESSGLLSFLGQGSLLAFGGSALSKVKSIFVGEAGKAMAIFTLTGLIGVVGVGGYAVYKHNSTLSDADANLQKLNDSDSNNVQTLPKKLFTPTKMKEQEIKTPQDAYFKIILWSNNEEDLKEATLDECMELDNMIQALKEYGGYYYNLLEKDGWLSNFYNFSKINER